MQHPGQYALLLGIAVACALVAQGRGRSGLAWFFIGFFFHVIGLILLLVLPDLSKSEDRRKKSETELRRLRERAAKDRQVADRRQMELDRRLAVHDRALGLDTAGAHGALDAAPADPPPLGEGALEASVLAADELDWYYAHAGAPVGPLDLDELRELLREGELNGATLVWSEATVAWRRASSVPELAEAARAR